MDALAQEIGLPDCNSTYSRPNPCISNFPPRTSSDWGIYVVSIWLAFVSLFACFLLFRLHRYRNVFPVSLVPVHLMAAMVVCMPLNSFSYLHSILVPSMPCWLHILLCNVTYLPSSGVAYAISLRLYVLYNAQYAMSLGQNDSWFVRNKDILKGYLFDVVIIAAAGVLSSGGMLTRYLGVRDFADLSLPVSNPRCSSFSTAQFVGKVLNGYVVLGLMKKVTELVKNVKESFQFRKLYNKVTRSNARMFVLVELPFWVKEFYWGLSDHGQTYYDCTLVSQLLFAIGFAMAYYIHLPFTITQAAAKVALHRNSTGNSSLGSSRRAEEKVVVVKVKSPGELKDKIYGDEALQESFKSYLVREFCVENMLFTKAVIKYKATVASTSGARDYVQDLIRNYVAEGSSFEINVSAALRTETLEHIQTALASTTDGTLPTDLFDKMEIEVFKMMLDPFNRYLRKSSSGALDEGNSSRTASRTASRTVSVSAKDGRKIQVKPQSEHPNE